MTEQIRVLIADDHEAVRSGVAAILQTDGEISVVAEAENGFDAVAACHREQPDVALLDLRMPGTDGIWATERITGQTATRVLVLTTYDSDELIAASLTAGAHGYLLKSTGGAELIAAVKHVAAERHVLDPAVAGSVIAGFASAVSHAAQSAFEGSSQTTSWSAGLTAREREVFALLSEGFTNQQIADSLNIGITTVKTHVGALYAKSGTSSRVELARRASTPSE